MTANEVLVHSLKMDLTVWNILLEDLSDADLLVRPVPGANHIAWQMGHVIVAEHRFVAELGKSMPDLPAHFVEQHSKETAGSDQGFLSKSEYLSIMASVRNATMAAVTAATNEELDRKYTGSMAQFCPTIGTVYALVASHATMHVGQVSVVRRKLGKPVKF
jgi:uncharacterized damage-inducible protein DinB